MQNDSVGLSAVRRSGRKRGSLFSGRILGSLLAAAVICLGFAAEAVAAPFSAMTVDARTGKILYQSNADSKRYPASLTKVMTLYILFEEMKAGRLNENSRFSVSPYAASRPPSKVGLKAGQTIRVKDAIGALVTKSANDVAATVAENIGGSEKSFAVRMTQTAKRLGMTRTTFRNASGLPNTEQTTTARDMATLGLRIQRDFPQYYKYFSMASYTYGGRAMRNHNRLLGTMKGIDGIKTGYTRASGFNLIASYEQSGRRIVGVVMGGRSGGARNTYMRTMLQREVGDATAKGKAIAAMAGDPPGLTEARATVVADARASGGTPPMPRSKPELAIAAAKAAQTPVALAALDEPTAEAADAEAGAGTFEGEGEGEDAASEAGETDESEEDSPVIAGTEDESDGEAMGYTEEADGPDLRGAGADFASAEPADRAEAADEPTAAFESSESPITTATLDPTAQFTGNGKGDLLVALMLPSRRAPAPPSVVTPPAAKQKKSQSRLVAIAPDPEPVITPASAKEATPIPDPGTWHIQVGAFPNQKGAQDRLSAAKAAGLQNLKDKRSFTMPFASQGNMLYRARFSGFDEKSARETCRALTRKGMGCFPLAPQG